MGPTNKTRESFHQRYACFLAALTLLLPSQWTRAQVLPFDKRIAPILASYCLDCHSGKRPKGGLDLSQKKLAFEGGNRGQAIVPGRLTKSSLWERVRKGEMPPKKQLPKAEAALLKQWIIDGAKWGTDPIDPYKYTTNKRAGYDWWALQPLRKPDVPKVQNRKQVHNPIDAFLLAKLENHKLTFSPEASPRALIRRLHFDLIGLPPSPAIVETFTKNPTDQAYNDIVAHLLASSHHGERWARHWLDVVRYGESDGFERNNPRKNLWHYRDWVIRVLNDDMPYDRFAKMQITGDILTNDSHQGVAAVGFLVSGVHNTVVGQSERMRKLARQDELEEIVGTLGQTFLGLTVNCARCHDHKFDPIRQEEYYRLIASLDGVFHGERSVNSPTVQKRIKTVNRKMTQLRSDIATTERPARLAIRQARKANRNRKPQPPEPLAAWNFDKDYKDSVGKLHGKPFGNAKIHNGGLILDGRSHVETKRIDRAFREKTLEAWVILDDLNQRGGGVMSLQKPTGATFDAIVYAEREPHRWMAGSDSFRRTRSFGGPAEKQAKTNPVHIAIVYRSDGTIIAYRNGRTYGKPYKTGFQTFEANDATILFGLRHTPPGGNKFLRGKILQARLYDRALSAEAVAASAGIQSDYVSEKQLLAKLSPATKKHRADLINKLAKLEAELAKLNKARSNKVYSVNPRNPGITNVLLRGDIEAVGKIVTPGGVSSISGLSADFGLKANASDAERRQKLAEWITSQNNPLFARVIVNRLWHYHFGAGLVKTPNDFGFNGGRPSHPQLLDWLASELQRQNYSLRAIHRLIVTSNAYRQSSRKNSKAYAFDANNRLLWRYSPRRLEAEAVRDSILQVAGQLNREMGGPGFVDVEIRPNNGTTYYTPFDPIGPQFHRRTIYRFSPRGGRSSLLDTFDCPDACATTPRRSVTTTPLQALSLLNNAFVLRMAENFTKRIEREAGAEIPLQVKHAFRLAYTRNPTARELKLASSFVREHGLASLCRALFNSNEFIIVE
ncbi:MAG: DUF1553 domain-containing protein [Gemmataceae bacterium]